MVILLWIIGIHLVELMGIGLYFLFRRNAILEKAINAQQQYIDYVAILIGQLDDSLQKIDNHMWVEGDDELKSIFGNIKEIQDALKESPIK